MSEFEKYFEIYKHVVPEQLISRFKAEVESYFPEERSKCFVYGRECTVPRDQIVMPDFKYKYSGHVIPSRDYSDIVSEIREWVSTTFSTGRPNVRPTTRPTVRSIDRSESKLRLDYVLINGYGDSDQVRAHADIEKSIDQTQPIVSISFGESRTFRILELDGKTKVRDIQLEEGDIVIMKAGAQSRFKHAILPKARKHWSGKRRYNMTWRALSTGR
jgi:hypothetical protein